MVRLCGCTLGGMDWLPVSVHNFVHVHIRQKAIFPKPMFCEYGQAHKSRQAPIQGYGLQHWAKCMVIMYAMMACHCWHSLIALIACLQAAFARMKKQLIRPASRSRAHRPGVHLEQGLPTMGKCWMSMVRVCLRSLSRTHGIFILKC
jgi:hypothetical protein